MAYGDGRTLSLAEAAKPLPTMTMLAGYARLLELEAKWRKAELETGRPLDADERSEYDWLMQWWANFGGEKQGRVIDIVKNMSASVHDVARDFSA